MYAPFDDEWLVYDVRPVNEQFAGDKLKRSPDKRPYLNNMTFGQDRKSQSIVPDIYKADPNPTIADATLKNMKRQETGIQRISIGKAKAAAEKYNSELPKRDKPYRMLGNTGIMLYRPAKSKFFLIKGEHLVKKVKRKVAKKELQRG